MVETIIIGGKLFMLKFQLKLIFKRKEFYYTFLIILMVAIVSFAQNCIKSFGVEYAELIPANQQMLIFCNISNINLILAIVMPFLISIPFADSYFTEKENRMVPPIITRGNSGKNYYFSKMFAVFLSAFFVILIPLLINFVLNMIAFPMHSELLKSYSSSAFSDDIVFDARYQQSILFSNLFLTHPYLYNLLFCLFISLFAGSGAVLTYALSFFVKKTRLLALGSFFILTELFIYILSFLSSFTGFDLVYYDYLLAFNGSGNSPLILAVIILSPLLAAFILTPFNLKKLRNIY